MILLLIFVLGGPLVAYNDKANRFVLMGSVHGAFSDCRNDFPGIYVEADDITVLEFLVKESYGTGSLKFEILPF